MGEVDREDGEGLRDDLGRFNKGMSGNPGGRPRDESKLRSRARELTDDALAVLKRALASADERIALSAATAILDRGWGKPAGEEIVAKLREDDDPGDDAKSLSDAELLQEAIARAKAIGART